MNPSNPTNPRFRLDRFLTLHFFGFLSTLGSRRNELRIPILMYHSISAPDEGKRIHSYYETCTSPRVFAEHMKFLHDGNYQVITLDHAVSLLKGPKGPNKHNRPGEHNRLNEPNEPNGPNGPRYVVLTFDDGFRDFYTEAFPILERFDFPATVFLPTAFIGNERKKFKQNECLTWSEVRKLHKKGLTFGSHTANHSKLIDLTRKEIEYELRNSKDAIENEIGEPVEAFCYPFAFPEQNREFVKMLLRTLKKCGYTSGVTTKIGTSGKRDDAFFLPRIPVNSLDDQSFFSSKLNQGYDWLQKFQYLYKKVKN